MMEESDDALLARARTGDRQAFEALVDRHYDSIHRIAWRHCGDRTEAEDIAQEVCIRIARAIRGFAGRAAFSTWYHAIAINAVRDAMRAKGRRAAAMKAVGVMALAGAALEVEAESLDDVLWAAVRALPERQREAVNLVYVEGLSHRDAARAIGCAEATLSWHLFAARQKLKMLLAGTGR
jgi:RNA polymerase sigma-70 factor (ECF subfamily)